MFAARVRPDTAWVGGPIAVSILIETKNADGNKGSDPRRYKAFHGASITPYTGQGISFAPFR